MNQAELEKLEQRVDDLIDVCKRLQGENRKLKQTEARLSDAHVRMNDKMQLARSRIESMIGRLKALERS